MASFHSSNTRFSQVRLQRNEDMTVLQQLLLQHLNFCLNTPPSILRPPSATHSYVGGSAVEASATRELLRRTTAVSSFLLQPQWQQLLQAHLRVDTEIATVMEEIFSTCVALTKLWAKCVDKNAPPPAMELPEYNSEPRLDAESAEAAITLMRVASLGPSLQSRFFANGLTSDMATILIHTSDPGGGLAVRKAAARALRCAVYKCSTNAHILHAEMSIPRLVELVFHTEVGRYVSDILGYAAAVDLSCARHLCASNGIRSLAAVFVSSRASIAQRTAAGRALLHALEGVARHHVHFEMRRNFVRRGCLNILKRDERALHLLAQKLILLLPEVWNERLLKE